MIKPQATYENFAALDIRTGTIIKVEDSLSKKPTYKMTIDFGPGIGSKISCGAYRNYEGEELLGKQVVCIINFAPLKMGPEISEALVLGVENEKGETIYLMPESGVKDGVEVF